MSTLSPEPHKSGTKTPNVLFIICDDLNTVVSRLGRKPSIEAPNIQRLIHRGVSFTNAHANCPICLPSRNSLYSGLLPHRSGSFTLFDNPETITPAPDFTNLSAAQPVLRDAVMLPKHFKNNGYQVYGSGKTLHNGETNSEWWTAYNVMNEPLTDFQKYYTYGPSHPILTENQKRLYESDALAAYVKRYDGIDQMFLDNGKFRHHIETAFGPLDEIFGQAHRPDITTNYRYVSDDDRDLLSDEITADWAVAFLQQAHQAPFFLNLGFVKPHSPLNVPRQYFDLVPEEAIELPPALDGDTEDCARALIDHSPFGFLMYDLLQTGGETMLKKWIHSYLACVLFLDEQVGKVLNALEASAYGDDTVIVLTSDNGYHMGDKNYLFKNSLWEESTRVPLLVAVPGGLNGGSVCAKPVSLVDLYPTLTDLCGLQPVQPNEATHQMTLDGESLRPFLENPEQGVRGGASVVLSSVRGHSGIHHSLRSERYRYTLCQNGEEELYDHDSDQLEWHNLADQAELQEVKARLRKQLLALLYP